MGFDEEAPGTVLVHFEDGSAVVKGDGSPEEAVALTEILRAGGVTDTDALEGISRALLSQGLTLVENAPDTGDPRTMGGFTFEAIAEALAARN